LLLDLSVSTARQIDDNGRTLLDCEREAAEQAIAAFDNDYTRIALHGFASNGRSEVRYLRLKDFGSPYGDEHRRRLQELQPAWSTRFGAALRHAGECMAAEKSPSKTIILVTDGEPSDIDVFDPKYLVEDARNAVDMLAAHGVRSQCLSVDPKSHSRICEIFGRQNSVSIERSTRLADILPNVLAKVVA
jgi:nitric oxide reductase activation protein